MGKVKKKQKTRASKLRILKLWDRNCKRRENTGTKSKFKSTKNNLEKSTLVLY